ncbi:MAG: hypothetical protein AUH77_08495 [Candidatus Rokubacteria bacterium 13_1_40CM_4_69_39]|nr:MAG: hypothetical protein AUH77_08495 [Candidatus Rokubacteria bacterium 13_1_40CM_4_69_39]
MNDQLDASRTGGSSPPVWSEQLIDEISSILADALVAAVEGERQRVVAAPSTDSPRGMDSRPRILDVA